MLLRLVARFAKPHWKLGVGVVVFQLAQAVASLYLPSLNADIIDVGVAQGDTAYVVRVGAVMLAITLLQVAAAIAAVYFGAKLAMLVGRDMRDVIFDHVGELSEREVAGFGAPSLITRTTNDVQQVQALVLMTCTLLVTAPILAVGGVVMALDQDLELSWLMVVAVPALLLGIGAIILRMVPLFRLMQARVDAVNLVLREQLTGIRVVRAFVREDLESRRFGRTNADVTDAATRAGRLFALVFPFVMLIMNVASVAVLWFGAFRVDSGTMQVGSLTAFLSYLIQILSAVMMATFMALMIPRAAASAERIGDVLGTPASVTPPDDGVEVTAHRGRVELRDVAFSYPGAEQPVLSGITFVAEPGRTTAVVGSTGAGKTTLLNLLPRLCDATGGTVLIGGVDVRDLDPEVLWSSIGLVPQRAYLFSGTIATNLRFGSPDASDEELWEALETAQAKDFVSALPEGLDAPIVQGGTNVSGGQRQRLAIARALVKRSPIYLFDDSFSALDSATDARLRRALAQRERDATMIIVAQRVSTIVDADQVLVIDDGRLVGAGTHDELLDSSEIYREIVSSQLIAEEAA